MTPQEGIEPQCTGHTYLYAHGCYQCKYEKAQARIAELEAALKARQSSEAIHINTGSTTSISD